MFSAPGQITGHCCVSHFSDVIKGRVLGEDKPVVDPVHDVEHHEYDWEYGTRDTVHVLCLVIFVFTENSLPSAAKMFSNRCFRIAFENIGGEIV